MTESKTIAKPVPVRNAITAEFFEGARQGQLMLQHCAHCGHYSLHSGKYCPRCLGELGWVRY
ncbi:zinc ribbon domain-containing protein [Burkholderia multivorans]|uniref:zinc ribbon domain-containing protein n=1 Tax=Burkholderia multivorans TaxID=87883 RepID=UPI00158B9780|nr:zinc ribbon domain-containing protein [Burkholderia multivorans]